MAEAINQGSSATLELIELVDEVQNLLSVDGSINFQKCEELLEKFKPTLSDPCKPLNVQSSSSPSVEPPLWRQGKHLPYKPELMQQQIKVLKSLHAGASSFAKLGSEDEAIRDKYFKNWSLKQMQAELYCLEKAKPFVENGSRVLKAELLKLQKVLGTETNPCNQNFCKNLWVDAHKALWNPNSEIRVKLESFLGQRLEAYLNIGGLGSAAKLVAWIWPSSPGYRSPVKVDIAEYHDEQPGKQGFDKEVFQYRKEIELEMELAARMAFLQREIAVDIVKDLMGARRPMEEERHTDDGGGGGGGGGSGMMVETGEAAGGGMGAGMIGGQQNAQGRNVTIDPATSAALRSLSSSTSSAEGT